MTGSKVLLPGHPDLHTSLFVLKPMVKWVQLNMRATINGFILFCAHGLYIDVSLCFPSVLYVEIVVRPKCSSGLLLLIRRPRTDHITTFVAVRDPRHVLLLFCTVVTWEGCYTGPARGLDCNSQFYASVDMPFNIANHGRGYFCMRLVCFVL